MPGSCSHLLAGAPGFELRSLMLPLLEAQPCQALGFSKSLLMLGPNPSCHSQDAGVTCSRVKMLASDARI